MSPTARTVAAAVAVLLLAPCALIGLVAGAFLAGPTASANTAPAVSVAGWALPLPAGSYRHSSPYGPRWGGFHYGQDLAAPTGTPIFAIAAGVVVRAECTSPYCDRPGAVDAHGMPATPGCGLTILLRHSQTVTSKYCHASRLAVHTGQSVAAGEVIGWIGSTGNSTGPHLHLQIHVGDSPVDPVRFLREHGVAL